MEYGESLSVFDVLRRNDFNERFMFIKFLMARLATKFLRFISFLFEKDCTGIAKDFNGNSCHSSTKNLANIEDVSLRSSALCIVVNKQRRLVKSEPMKRPRHTINHRAGALLIRLS